MIIGRNGGRWANDQIIDSYASLLVQQRHLQALPTLPVHLLSCYVMSSFIDQGQPDPSDMVRDTSTLLTLEPAPHWLRDLRSFARINDSGQVYFPFNSGHHWVFARFDIESRDWSYGNPSSRHPIPLIYAEACDQISTAVWGRIIPRRPAGFPSELKLTIGKQKDNDSCGYFVVDAMRHHLLGFEISDQTQVHRLRLEVYLAIIDSHLQEGQGCITRLAISTAPQAADVSQSSDIDHWHPPCASVEECSDPPLCNTLSSPMLTQQALPDRPPSMSPTPVKAQNKLLFVTEQERFKQDQQQVLDPINAKRLWRFKKDCRKIDKQAAFDSLARPGAVKCSECRTWRKMQQPFSARRFRSHFRQCRANLLAPRTEKMFAIAARSAQVKAKESVQREIGKAGASSPLSHLPPVMTAFNGPCPGLTADIDERIATYFGRTTAEGGGAVPRRKLLPAILGAALWTERSSRRLMKQQPPHLDAKQRQRMLLEEQSRLQWRNRQHIEAIYSAKCTGHSNDVGGPCDDCMSLFDLQSFGRALRKGPPKVENAKYTPNEYKGGYLRELINRYRGLDRLYAEDGKAESSMLKAAKMLLDPDIDGCE